MFNLSWDTQADVFEAFNDTWRFLDGILNIDNLFFSTIVNNIYPKVLQLNKANISDTNAFFLDLHISIENVEIISNIYDKSDDFNFDIVNYHN